MRTKTSLTIVCLLSLTLTGCVFYRHARAVDGNKKKESTVLGTIFKKGEAALVQSQTIDNTNGKTNGYSRTIGAQQIKSEVDAKGISAAGSAAGEAGKTFIKP